MTTYAINKVTKEHRVVPYAMDGDATWSYVDTDEYGFIPWKGSNIAPVKDDVMCEVQFDISAGFRVYPAQTIKWDRVTRYRPILSAPNLNTKYSWEGQECTLLGKSQQHGQAAIQIDDTNELWIVDLDDLQPPISALVDEAVMDIQMEPDVHVGTIYDIVGRMIKKGYRKP